MHVSLMVFLLLPTLMAVPDEALAESGGDLVLYDMAAYNDAARR